MTLPAEQSVFDEAADERKSFSNLCLRLAPLIDVIFLLLIFFFISAQFAPPEAALPLDLPAAYSSDTGIARIVEPLNVYVFGGQNGCKIEFAQTAVGIGAQTAAADLTGFAEQLAVTLKAQKRVLADPLVLIFADDVQWDYVAKIYNLLYGIGIEDVTVQLKTEN